MFQTFQLHARSLNAVLCNKTPTARARRVKTNVVSSRLRKIRHLHDHVQQGHGPTRCRSQRSLSDNRWAAWLLISLSSECEMSGHPNTLQNHCDLGENRSLNQQRLRIMRFNGSTDPNSFFAPEPHVLSIEREWCTDSNSLHLDRFGGRNLRTQLIPTHR